MLRKNTSAFQHIIDLLSVGTSKDGLSLTGEDRLYKGEETKEDVYVKVKSIQNGVATLVRCRYYAKRGVTSESHTITIDRNSMLVLIECTAVPAHPCHHLDEISQGELTRLAFSLGRYMSKEDTRAFVAFTKI